MSPITEQGLLTLLGPKPTDAMILESLSAYFESIGWGDVVSMLNSHWPSTSFEFDE